MQTMENANNMIKRAHYAPKSAVSCANLQYRVNASRSTGSKLSFNETERLTRVVGVLNLLSGVKYPRRKTGTLAGREGSFHLAPRGSQGTRVRA